MSKKKINKAVRNIVISYFVFGSFWILFSDFLGGFIADNLSVYQRYQSIKGIIFVLATGIFLFFLLKRNFKDLQAKEEKLFKQAYFDSLTSLPNKNSLYSDLNKKINQEKRECFALFYLNLKDIENLTEIKGYSHGSDLIKKLALHLQKSSCLEKSNCSIYSYNYDQFILIFDKLSNDKLIKKEAEAVLTSVKELWNQGKIDYYLNLKIGISKFPDSGDEAEALLSAAQLAAHSNNLDNKNFKIYDQQMYLNKLEYENLKRDLRNAVQNQEFKLFYQPKINLQTDKISGVEALIRWEHPLRGLVSPYKFIEIAEKSGLIREIGDWVIEESFQQLSKWQNKYQGSLSLSFNLSPVELYNKNKIVKIKKLSQKYGIRKNLVEFEITENALLDNHADTINFLNQLKDLGFSIALDDFGIGYSSFSYLSRLPIDTLKIDKSFIKKLSEPKNLILIEALIKLSHKMNLKVVAEGIETSEQLQTMKKFNCDEIQGYYFYQALSLDKIENILEKNHNQ